MIEIHIDHRRLSFLGDAKVRHQKKKKHLGDDGSPTSEQDVRLLAHKNITT